MTWQEAAAQKRAKLAALIPDDVKLPTIPGPEVLNVTNYPLDSVLSARDLEITNTADVGILLEKLSTGAWTATEVTSAYCKRALAAHQLASTRVPCSHTSSQLRSGQLSYGDIHRSSFDACEGA